PGRCAHSIRWASVATVGITLSLRFRLALIGAFRRHPLRPGELPGRGARIDDSVAQTALAVKPDLGRLRWRHTPWGFWGASRDVVKLDENRRACHLGMCGAAALKTIQFIQPYTIERNAQCRDPLPCSPVSGRICH
ncbi:MAG: hypothetical protein R6W76_22650, partial [Caldilinea sp.]